MTKQQEIQIKAVETHPEMLRRNMILQIANGRFREYQFYIFDMKEDEFMALCEQMIIDNKIHERHFSSKGAMKALKEALDDHRNILVRLGAISPRYAVRTARK